MGKGRHCIVACIFLAVSLGSLSVRGQEPEQPVKSSVLSRDSILIGDQIVWSTRISLPEKEEIAVFPYAPLLRQSGDMYRQGPDSLYDDPSKIEVIEDFVLDTMSIKSGIKEVEVRAVLTSFDSGSFKLPRPLILRMTGGEPDTLDFATPVLSVNTIQIDTATFEPFDIKGQMLYPVKFKEVFPWILLAVGILALIYVVYRYIQYRRENKDFFGRPVVKDPPHIVALRELEKLRNQKLWQNGKEKQFYTGIADTLREYIEKRFGVSAMEKTSSEIMDSLAEKKIEDGPYGELDELFKLADLVKFAKYIPSVGENEDAVPKAVRFVNSTFMQELEEEKGGK